MIEHQKPPTTAVRLRAVIARVDRLLARELTGAGLTRTQFSVLGALTRAGELRLADLVERERVHPTMLSRVVARLVELGWVTREADPEDGRAAVLRATPDGRDVHRRLQEQRAQRIEDHLQTRSEADRAALAAVLPLLEGLADHLADHLADVPADVPAGVAAGVPAEQLAGVANR